MHLVAKEHGVTLTSFTATARGDLDPSKLEEIVRISETRCPVSDNLANVTPVSIKIAKLVPIG